MGEPQIALDWLEQMDRVLKNLRVPDADRSELASQIFRKGAYDWWKRIDQDPHTPKPWTWDRFNRAFTKEYVPTRYREERRDEFVALKQEGMSLPELRQKFDYLSQYATSLVSTPEDRLNEFVKKLRPDLRPYAALITTTDFNAAYDLIVKTEKSLDDLQATKKEDRATKDLRPAASTGPSGKSFGFGGKSLQSLPSVAKPPPLCRTSQSRCPSFAGSPSPPLPATTIIAVESNRRRCFLRRSSAAVELQRRRSPFPSQSPPLLPSPVAAALIVDELQRRHAERWTSPPLPASFLADELQRRQSLLIAVELPLRHCRRRPSPSPHPAAFPS
ncbi:unnamed protein product [Cuscuta campestris]|uniref:Retrotransposon gag domain-containing protein n=1 Tax=Cuscuta campestris TaxID=132261 RepID=A0A484M556_9ASTE|nr:unnamed protein product [Cuscuta campestris]